jgi:hypothetical protein
MASVLRAAPPLRKLFVFGARSASARMRSVIRGTNG